MFWIFRWNPQENLFDTDRNVSYWYYVNKNLSCYFRTWFSNVEDKRLSFYNSKIIYSWASLVAQTVKNLPAKQETQVWSLVGKIPWRRKWQPTPESHGQRSLAGYSLWGRKELDTAERLHFLSFLVRLRERHKLMWHNNLKETENFILANLKLTLQNTGEKVLCKGRQWQTKQDTVLTEVK